MVRKSPSRKPKTRKGNGRPRGAGVDSRREPTLEEMVAAQGIKPFKENDERLAQGAELWDDDEEFDRFIEWLNRSRRSGG